MSVADTAAAPEPPVVVRPATGADHPAVVRLLGALELDYPGRDLAAFHVALIDDEIVACAELRRVGGSLLLSCVGVREDLQGRGIGRRLVHALTDGARADVHLFTLEPRFFDRLGFEDAPPPAGLVRGEIYGCVGCFPDRCRSLSRKSGAVPRDVA